MKLTLKAIIRFEQITGKPFSSMSEEDAKIMIYCCLLSERVITIDELNIIYENKKQQNKLIRDFSRAMSVEASLQSKEKVEGESSEDQYIKDIVSTLIVSGIDANYLMNEASISDLPILMKAYEANKKEQMESSRLWTYLSILPHVDGKKLKSPKDLMIFPWEEENIKSAIEDSIDYLDDFLNNGSKTFKIE